MAKRPSKWVICYIDASNLRFLKRDLSRFPKYRLIKVYIPTVKILTKQFKGRSIFEEVPLLFNYGFFEVPNYFIYNPHFLDKMKKEIRCIYGWVKDPANTIQEKPKLRLDYKNANSENPNGVALATTEEIVTLMDLATEGSTFAKEDVNKLRPGIIVVLKGYPFEGLNAEIIAVDDKKKEVEVRLLLETHMSHIKLSFDNVFYSVYHSEYMNVPMREESIEVIRQKMSNINRIYDGND
jgi:hypothetical protein